MRKLFFFFLSISFFSVLNAQKLSFVYNIEKPNIQQIGDYQLLSFSNSYQIAELGSPSLPFLPVKLLLPDGTVAKSIEFKFENEKNIQGKFNILPMQNVRPMNYNGQKNFVLDQDVYKLKDYPSFKSSDVNTEFMNGYAFALAKFTPVRYNPSNGELSYYSRVIVTVKLAKNNQKNIVKLDKKPQTLKKISDFADNYKDVKGLSQAEFSVDNYEMLIITADEYENSFDELINNHKKRGIRSKVVTLNQIDASVDGIDMPEKMRNYIIQEYQNHGILYVLLGGDADVVPFRNLFCEALSGEDIYSGQLPADIYFSSLDGNWNDDKDSKWGEPDEDDLLPDVAVGRITFSNQTELSNIIHKIISYSYSPVTSTNELNNPLFAGEFLWGDPETWGGDALDLLIGDNDDYGYSTSGIPDGTDVSKMYEKDGLDWKPNKDIIDSMNNGHSFVYHIGHTNYYIMMGLLTEDITSENFSKLDGVQHNYALLYSHGCIAGAFDVEDCVSESMVKIEKGAVGVFTNSRYGWFNEGTANGPSEHLNREFVDALYSDKENTAGVTEMISKIQTAPWVGLSNEHEPGAQRWVFYDHNVLTDPSLPIWTAKPLDITTTFNTDLKYGSDLNINVSVSGGSNENLTCILMQDNKIFGRAYTDINGNATIKSVFDDIKLGNASLIVSGYNVLPQEYSVNIISVDTAILNIENIIYYDGNDNNPQSNEQYSMALNLVNYGAMDATNVLLTISSQDTLIRILDNEFTKATVLANSSESFINVFTVVDTCMNDQHEVVLDLQISTDNYTYNRKIKYIVDAPKIENSSVDFTEVTGNGDDYIDAGETWNINLGFLNSGHSTSASTIGFALNDENDITFTNNEYIINPIIVDDTYYVNFDFSVEQSVEQGKKIKIISVFDNCDFPDSLLISFYAGKVDEDFETADFNKFEWVNSSNSEWTIDSNNSYEGNYCAKSGAIDDSEESVLKINLNLFETGNISFAKKLSTLFESDYLLFYVDGSNLGYWTGISDWEVVSYELSQGQHKLEWKYKKDDASFAGEDCAWVDNITFPPFSEVTTKINVINDVELRVYPIPFKEKVFFNINSDVDNFCKIIIIDISGKEIYNKVYDLEIGENIIEWNSDYNLAKGTYFYKIIMNEKIMTGKIIKN